MTNDSSGWIASDLKGSYDAPLDPKLGLLQANGGPTWTMALLPGSPAIDAGDDAPLAPPLNLTTDQRSFPRKSGAHLDIGALELQLATTPLYFSSDIVLSNAQFQAMATNIPGASLTILAATNISLPLSNWTVLGTMTETSSGQFQFTDSEVSSTAQRFYRLRSP